MKLPENRLWKEDEALFASMEGHYRSENEKVFFEKIRYKMEFEIAPSNDLIMFEKDRYKAKKRINTRSRDFASRKKRKRRTSAS